MREQKSGKVAVGRHDGEERAQVSSNVLVPNACEIDGRWVQQGP